MIITKQVHNSNPLLDSSIFALLTHTYFSFWGRGSEERWLLKIWIPNLRERT